MRLTRTEVVHGRRAPLAMQCHTSALSRGIRAHYRTHRAAPLEQPCLRRLTERCSYWSTSIFSPTASSPVTSSTTTYFEISSFVMIFSSSTAVVPRLNL